MKNNPCILSVDQGTSGSKVLIFALNGDILATCTTEYEISHPQPGYVEIDPIVLWGSVRESLDGVIRSFEASGGRRIDIRSIGISNQRESFLIWDENGTPLSPVVVWQCKRSADLCRKLNEDAGWPALVSERTGLVNDPYFSGTKASVLVSENPEIAAKMRSGTAYFGTIDTWLAWKLTDGRTYATDRSNASRTMLFDINRMVWDKELINRLGLEGLRLPEVRLTDAGYGETDLGNLLPNPIPIGSLIGDSHAASFAEGLFRAGDAKVTLGTGSSILMNVGAERVDSTRGMVSTICWSAGDRTDYALEGIIVSCGSTITWLKDSLGMFADNRDIDILAESVDDAGSVYLVPAFSGIGAPWWKLDARASIQGLDFGHDRRHIARAALESIIFQTKDVLAAMESDMGRPLASIKADGGITVSDFVMNGIASLVNRTVQVPLMKQASGWGAALLAGLSIGLYRDLEEIDRTISARETKQSDPIPDLNLAKRYTGWRSILQDY